MNTAPAHATWTNWVGNQSANPARVVAPRDETELQQAVVEAVAYGLPIRAVGAGHSFTPVCVSEGLLIETDGLSGVVATSTDRCRATLRAGTRISDLGEPLWEAGLSLRNQGDIDTQSIAGAISTGTHGSGVRLPSFSASVRSARLVLASGDVLEIGEHDPDLLRAAQVGVGMLGVFSELGIEVEPAYRLRERLELWPFARVLEEWDERVAEHRHFSCFWLPSEASGELYGLPVGDGASLADCSFVKIYDLVDPDEPDDATRERRVDRAYRIYPGIFAANFHELEYMVPLERAGEAISAMRELMLRWLPASIFPLEIRTTAGDRGMLSPNHGRPSLVLSVSGVPGTDYWPYLRAVDGLLDTFDGRPHWGKLHLLTRERLDRLYPEADRFREIRRSLDPGGVFLNDHLRPLFE